jgi:hypothetical protein
MCGSGFHNGLFGGNHRVLPLHGARQVSGGNEFDQFVINDPSERNQISDPAFHRIPTDQKMGTPLFHTNGFYKPELMYSITGINSHPAPTRWYYPDVHNHATEMKETHGVGLGVYYGAGNPEQYSKGSSGSHAGLPSALHKINNIHGTAGLGSYRSAVGPNSFHRIGVKEDKTGGLPIRSISGHYEQLVGHGAMVAPVMEIHKDIPDVHRILPSGHENAVARYHAVANKEHQGLANTHNFGLHNDIHMGGTGQHYEINGYHRGEYDDGYSGSGYPWGGYYGLNGHHMGGYHGGGYNGNKYYQVEQQEVNSYHGMNGYLENGDHKSAILKRHGSFEYNGSLQKPTLLRTGSEMGDKLTGDQNIMSSMFKDETYLIQEKQDETPYSGKGSSDHRTLIPSTDISKNAETVTGDVIYKMEDDKESTLFPEGMENKFNNMEEVSGNYTKSSDDISSINKHKNSNFLYETDIPKAAHPSTLNGTEWSDIPYARGLHVDLLHGGTATVEAESDVQAAEEIGLTEGQSGISAKQITKGGSGNHGNPEVLQHQHNPQEPGYLLGSVNDKLAGGRLGFQSHQSQYDIDRKSWSEYNSCKYNNGVDFGYRLIPLIYQPWYYSYDQYYMTPYHSLYRLRL